jgi:hypothetical protein
MQRSAFLKLAATTTFAAGTRLAFPWAAAAANRPVRFRGALYRAGGKGRIQTSVNGGRSWKLHSNIGGMYSIKRLTVHNGRLHLSVAYEGRTFPLVLARDKRSWRTH